MSTHESAPTTDVIVRTSARVLVLDPQDRLLLLAARDPADGRVVWFVPGGGVEAGETLEEAARRELAEEVPQARPQSLHGPVWTRQHDFSWNGRSISQTEWFYVCRLAEGFAASEVIVGGTDAQFFEGARWASLADLSAWPASEIMAPRRLAELLSPILAGIYPAEPIEAGL